MKKGRHSIDSSDGATKFAPNIFKVSLCIMERKKSVMYYYYMMYTHMKGVENIQDAMTYTHTVWYPKIYVIHV